MVIEESIASKIFNRITSNNTLSQSQQQTKKDERLIQENEIKI